MTEGLTTIPLPPQRARSARRMEIGGWRIDCLPTPTVQPPADRCGSHRHSLFVTCRGVEQRQLAGLITRRSWGRVPPPLPTAYNRGGPDSAPRVKTEY